MRVSRLKVDGFNSPVEIDAQSLDPGRAKGGPCPCPDGAARIFRVPSHKAHLALNEQHPSGHGLTTYGSSQN